MDFGLLMYCFPISFTKFQNIKVDHVCFYLFANNTGQLKPTK